MSFIDNSEFENKDCKDVLERIINVASNYDIYDFICRLAGLNLLSDNQNKSVLIDTLIQYILVRPRDIYTSKIKMSDKKFKTLIDELNSTFLSASIDPCENTFIQYVMLNGRNYRVFNGIDITPAFNLQTVIRVLFFYKNDYSPEYLEKTNRLFSLLLGLSEEKTIAMFLLPQGTVFFKMSVATFSEFTGKNNSSSSISFIPNILHVIASAFLLTS